MNKYKKIFPIFGFIAGIFFSALIFLSYKTENGKTAWEDFEQRVFAVKMKPQYHFAGEEIPLNEDTRERLDRELNVNAYLHGSTILNLKLAKKFFPIIEPILAKNNIPDDFKYVAVAESGLTNATSPASAKGYWQFMANTGKSLGLEISNEVDERYHLEKSTQAACDYLNELYRKFRNWSNVAAAYNVGPTSFSRSMESQKELSYYDMNINSETSRYVFRVVAIKEVMQNPEKYGFFLDAGDWYENSPKMKEIKVTESIDNLADFAHDYRTTYRLLKYYNPWLLKENLTVSEGKEYIIKIPL